MRTPYRCLVTSRLAVRTSSTIPQGRPCGGQDGHIITLAAVGFLKDFTSQDLEVSIRAQRSRIYHQVGARSSR